MASLFDSMASRGQTALNAVHGDTATFKAGGTGSGTTITMIPTESPMLMIGDNQGQAEDRTIQLQVLVADVPAPKRGDTYAITSSAFVGVWTHSKIIHRNNTRWTIECKLVHHNELGAASVREIKS